MIKKKLLLLPLILTLILVLGISFTAAGCSCGINDTGSENLPPVIVRLYVSPETTTPGGNGTVTVEATDETDEILSYKWSIQSGGGSVIDQNLPETKWVAPNNAGTFVIQVTISDQSGGVTYGVINVTVVADAAPVITLLGDAEVNINVGDVYTDAGATASDDVDGNITASIVVGGTVNTSAAGSYVLTYNVSDSAGNAALEVSRTVNVLNAATGGQTDIIKKEEGVFSNAVGE
jgi:hypothetical protein